MPRSKQTALASASNVIKININSKTKKPRKRRARKVNPKPLPAVPLPPILMRSTAIDGNILRDIQISQTSLSDLTKKNTEEIRRLSSLASTISTPITSPPPVPGTPITIKLSVPKTNPKIKEIRKKIETLKGGKKLFDDISDPQGLSQSGAVPAPRNPVFGGAGAENVASYQTLLDTKKKDGEIKQKYYDTINGFDNIRDLKGWANRYLSTNQNASKKSLEELKEYLKTEPSFYDTFYAREIAQYPTPQKGGADDSALNSLES